MQQRTFDNRKSWPDYIRLPKEKTLCPYSQLSRGKVRELIEPRPGRPIPPVESFVLPNLGKGQKGVRMVGLKSLMAHLDQAAEKARREREIASMDQVLAEIAEVVK